MTLKHKPPVTVIIVCAFELLGLILLPSAFFKETTKAMGLWYQMYLVLTGIASASIIWYLWKMRRGGLYIYFGSYAVHNLVAVIVGNWLFYVLLIPIIGAVLLLPHVKKMSDNYGKDFA
jgi:uncharacterized membrane protein YwaF